MRAIAGVLLKEGNCTLFFASIANVLRFIKKNYEIKKYLCTDDFIRGVRPGGSLFGHWAGSVDLLLSPVATYLCL